MKKYRTPLLVVAIAIAILAIPLAVSAENQWKSYKWDSDTSVVSLEIENNLGGSAWDIHLAAAITDWNVSTNLDLTALALLVNGRAETRLIGRPHICWEINLKNGKVFCAREKTAAVSIRGASLAMRRRSPRSAAPISHNGPDRYRRC